MLWSLALSHLRGSRCAPVTVDGWFPLSEFPSSGSNCTMAGAVIGQVPDARSGGLPVAVYALKRRLGFGIMDLVLEHRDVDLDVVEEVVRGVIDLVRRAVGSGSGGGELHLEDTPYIRHLRGEE